MSKKRETNSKSRHKPLTRVGRRLRELREAAGLSFYSFGQGGAGERSLSRRIWMAETTTNLPTPETLARIAEHMGLPAKELADLLTTLLEEHGVSGFKVVPEK